MALLPAIGLVAFMILLSSASAKIGNSLDPSTYSNVEEFKPIHLSFEMSVNFDTSSVEGVVTHTLESLNSESTVVYMDVWEGLQVTEAEFLVENVADCPMNMTTIPFNVSTPNPNIGSALSLELPCAIPEGNQFFLKLAYVTDEDNLAISWMTPEQTSSQTLPFMYR